MALPALRQTTLEHKQEWSMKDQGDTPVRLSFFLAFFDPDGKRVAIYRDTTTLGFS